MVGKPINEFFNNNMDGIIWIKIVLWSIGAYCNVYNRMNPYVKCGIINWPIARAASSTTRINGFCNWKWSLTFDFTYSKTILTPLPVTDIFSLKNNSLLLKNYRQCKLLYWKNFCVDT